MRPSISIGAKRRRCGSPGGGKATVKLVEIKETHDSLRETLRRAEVTVEINGRTTILTSGNYRLPVRVQ